MTPLNTLKIRGLDESSLAMSYKHSNQSFSEHSLIKKTEENKKGFDQKQRLRPLSFGKKPTLNEFVKGKNKDANVVLEKKTKEETPEINDNKEKNKA